MQSILHRIFWMHTDNGYNQFGKSIERDVCVWVWRCLPVLQHITSKTKELQRKFLIVSIYLYTKELLVNNCFRCGKQRSITTLCKRHRISRCINECERKMNKRYSNSFWQHSKTIVSQIPIANRLAYCAWSLSVNMSCLCVCVDVSFHFAITRHNHIISYLPLDVSVCNAFVYKCFKTSSHNFYHISSVFAWFLFCCCCWCFLLCDSTIWIILCVFFFNRVVMPMRTCVFVLSVGWLRHTMTRALSTPNVLCVCVLCLCRQKLF